MLVSTMMVGFSATSAEAATGCEDPDTTWVGPSTEGGSASWDEPTNWDAGVPVAESMVCIPAERTGPVIDWGTFAAAQVIDADGAAIKLSGELTVGSSLDVAELVGDFGTLNGPGTTTVTGRITGSRVTFFGAAVVNLAPDSVLDAEVQVWNGSRFNVLGSASLADGARVDSFDRAPGLFTITETGSLTLDAADASVQVIGGFANHGTVDVNAGTLIMMGASPEDALPDQFSTGTFAAAPDAFLNVALTELRTDARLDHVTADHITVPADNTVTVADSTLVDADAGPYDPAGPPSIAGAGELAVADGTELKARIGGSLSVTVPAGEVVNLAGTLRDQADLLVHGEVVQIGDLYLDDEAVLDIYGTHKMTHGDAIVDFTGDDPGVEVIHPGGQLSGGQDSGLVIVAPFVNEGTVDSGAGQIHLGPRVESPSPSSGIFLADRADSLLLASNVPGEPPLVLDQAIVEGDVAVGGEVLASGLDLRGKLTTRQTGQLTLSGATTLGAGAHLGGVGPIVVGGSLVSAPGPEGTATIAGAEVTGSVRAASGTLSIPSLAPTTLAADGTLVKGEWSAAPGATLDLPAVTTNDAQLSLEGPGGSFADSLATLTGNGPSGVLNLLGGGDLAVVGPFHNNGEVGLSPGSRLNVGGRFRQLAAGTLTVEIDSAGVGRVRADGRRDLAGTLVVDRARSYRPPVGTIKAFLTCGGRVTRNDAFDTVTSPRFRSRKLRVVYEAERVLLRVGRVG